MTSRLVLIGVQIDPADFLGAPDTDAGAVELAKAMVVRQADFPEQFTANIATNPNAVASMPTFTQAGVLSDLDERASTPLFHDQAPLERQIDLARTQAAWARHDAANPGQ